MSDPVFKKDSVYQKFDLKELFGVDVSDMPELREAFGQAVLEKIKERTAAGEFRPNSRPSSKAYGYSDEYADSVAFKAAGKSKRDVNMELTGDMMNLMDILESKGSQVKIGWDDELQAAKAYNHNKGETVPKRPFFGLSRSEVKDIVRELEPQVQKRVRIFEKEGRSASTEFALKLLEKVRRIERASEDDE